MSFSQKLFEKVKRSIQKQLCLSGSVEWPADFSAGRCRFKTKISATGRVEFTDIYYHAGEFRDSCQSAMRLAVLRENGERLNP